MKDNLDQTIDGNRKILAGYEQFASQIKDFSTIGNDIDLDQLGDPSQLNDLISTLQGGKKNVTTMHDKAVKSNPELAKDNEFQTSYQTTIGQLDTAIDGVKSVQEEMKNIRQQYGKLGNVKDILQQKVVTPLDQLNRNFKKNIDGQQEISNGIGKMLGGINDLQSGLNQAGNGQGKVVGQLPSLRDGLAKIYGGQKRFETSLHRYAGSTRRTFQRVERQFGRTEKNQWRPDGCPRIFERYGCKFRQSCCRHT
ncbi:hypothetical protein RWE15_17945 [Virgibacillus halophilus]|uniref:LXG domain of WXG superfamily protein n=1 Tax=Tigheibacillus halophilus TaxID=361280 RepID=A0ABU5CBH9_9BACI|nr:hypothetical protein [Virgibacillus halophilus]